MSYNAAMVQTAFVPIDDDALRAYSAGARSALDIKREFNATFADILVGLAKLDLPFPRAPTAGRENEIATAREWLFPHAV
ncbi:MAG TPA: hypothetical protein VEA80_07540 [Vitreimonas sp.]|nr:hypothetical protein [Vitreimonas sp.]